MANRPLDTHLLDRAIGFAVQAHAGTERRGKGYPYILHPLEAAAIAATITPDQEILAAAVLHDTVEDTDVTVEALRAEFGDRIAELVAAESDDPMEHLPASASWHTRKQAAIDRLARASHDAKIVAMGDKLSNMRAIAQDYAARGEELWKIFHVTDRREHEWHYRGLAASLSELSGTAAYQEFVRLIDEVFCQPVRIDLADYEPAGEGANGSSYNHRTDPDVMLKLYKPGVTRQPMDEVDVARKVFEAGIPTPEPGELVTDGERLGIRFRRIPGKVSFSRAIGEDPSRVGEFATLFAQMCRQLHATRLDTTRFENVKDRYLRLLDENPFFTDFQKGRIAAFIRQAPDADTAIHGDLQFSNVIFSGDKRYFIDLGDFCYGHPLFDLGMVYLCSKLSSEDFIRETYHMDKSTAIAFWDAFVPAYFGSDADPQAIEREVRIYAGLKTLIIERDTRCPMPEFRAALEPLFK